MGKHVLITGGAGFVGSHLAIRLLEQGCEVRALDNLCSQVHGRLRSRPQSLTRDIELIEGDIRDPDVVYHALGDIDVVFHLASAIGGKESMRQVSHFVEINNLGTAVLLESMVEQQVERLILASSMAVYGEGLYRDSNGSEVRAASRSAEQIGRREWDIRDDQGVLTPVPTPEHKVALPGSVYAVSKRDQEQMCLMMGTEYGVPVTVLRLFNVYGPRLLPGNFYTGELSAFAAHLCAGIPPAPSEDGCQLRDWVSVHDVVDAFELAMASKNAVGETINIGSGRPVSTSEVAQTVADVMGMPEIEPEASGEHIPGSIRHCFADISKARRILGYEPSVSLENGLAEMSEWLACSELHSISTESSREPLSRGLVV